MNVFIDVTSSCRSGRNTGMQRTTRRIFSELSKRVSVTAICWNGLGNFYHQLGAPEQECLTAPFRGKRRAQSRPELFGENFPGELRRLLGRNKIDMFAALRSGDVLLAPDIYAKARTKTLPELIRKTKASSIAIFHDAAALRLDLLSSEAAKQFRDYIESLTAFDLVICISEESRADLLKFWKQFGIEAVPEICVEGWPVEFDERERAGDSPTGRKIILYVSSFTPRKNHLKLFEAAKELWRSGIEFELRLIGSSTGNFGLKIVPQIRLLQTAGWPIRWLKHVDDVALHRAYRECSFTVYPSLQEGFGLPILESLWHGKPCVCGNNGALGEVAEGGGCFYVDQTSAASIAEGIRRLLRDGEVYQRLCAEARARKFRTWSNYIDKLLEYMQRAKANMHDR
ncbi:MAG: hypothetical protein QOI04_2271 [Verrucomicrobiota bacterium]|jgi:hypothetical protein